MKPTVIYVDVDEVLADWIGALFRLLGLGHEQQYDLHARWDNMSPRPWDVTEVLKETQPKLSANGIWRRIDEAGEAFWADVEIFPFAHDLISVCETYAPVVLLTSPSLHSSSHAGKAQWIARHFGRDFREYLIGSVKHRCAHPRAVLVDDSPKNCERFRNPGDDIPGGRAILFPGVGNNLHHIPEHERVQYVADQLERLVAS